MRKFWIVFLYSSLCLIWGSTWLAIKISLNGIPPILGAGLRFVVAAAVVLAILAARGTRIRLSRDDWTCVFSCGVFGFTLNYVGVYWAEQYISSGLAAILFSTMPLLVALLSHFWTRAERLTLRKTAGIVIGMAGTAILFWPEERLSWLKLFGMAGTLVASLSAAVNLVMMKRYGKHTDIYVLNGLGMSFGALTLTGISLLTESYAQLAWSRSNLLALAYLALFGTVAAFLTFYHLVKVMDATLLSMITLIFPIVAVVLGRAFLHEHVSKGALLGIATVLAGVAVAIGPVPSTLSFRRRKAAFPPGQGWNEG